MDGLKHEVPFCFQFQLLVWPLGPKIQSENTEQSRDFKSTRVVKIDSSKCPELAGFFALCNILSTWFFQITSY